MDNRVILFLGLAAMLLVAALFIQSYGNLSDIPEQPVVISYDSANAEYKAVAANGTLVYTLSDLSTTLQNCIDYLPRPLDIELRLYGRHNLTTRILMYGGNVQIRGVQWGSTATRSTQLTYTGGYTPYGVFIMNTSYSTATVAAGVDYYTIRELKIVGNSAGCVYMVTTAGVGNAHVDISDVQVYPQNTSDTGFNLGSGQVYTLKNCYAEGANKGFVMNGWNYYCTVENCFAYNCKTNFHFAACSDVDVYGIMAYSSSLYNGIFIENCHDVNFYGIKARSNKNHGISISGGVRLNFYGAQLLDNSQETNNTYSGFNLYNYSSTPCSRISIIGGSVASTTTTKMHKYAVREVDANQDYNLVSGLAYSGCGTDDISLQGANSIETDCR